MRKCTDLPEDYEIEALIPCYTEAGDEVRVYLRDGTIRSFPVRMKAMLKALAARHAKSLTLLRAHARREGKGRQSLPLAIGTSLILLPCKMRRPRIAGDETMGCINAAIAARVEKREQGEELRSVVHLATGREIPLLWSAKTAEQHFRAARLLYYEEAARQRRELDAGIV